MPENLRQKLHDFLTLQPFFTPRCLDLFWMGVLVYFAADVAQSVFWLFHSVGLWAWIMSTLHILWLVMLACFLRLFLEMASVILAERKASVPYATGVPHAD